MERCDALTTAAHGRAVGPGAAALAVDVGGTAVKIGLVDPRGVITDGATVATPGPGPGVEDRIVGLVTDAAEGLRNRYGRDAVAAVSVVVPGIVDEARGLAVHSANLGWRGVPFAQKLRDRTGLPATMSHDVRAAGLAEFGDAGAAHNAVMITIGTGIAAALRIDGRSYSSGGYAGEVGFLEVNVETSEGLFTGPLENIASTRAIAEAYTRRTGRAVNGSADVLARIGAGDRVAAQVWDGALGAIHQACHQIVTLLAPEAIILGGGLSEEAGISAAVSERLEHTLTFHRRPALSRARLGSAAGLIGAAMLSRDDPSVSVCPQRSEQGQRDEGGSVSR
ncbi:ROK family protein [Nocardiopsis sp. HNM0947]|uniref:ROK family protein n=1 Tax=Nocardiopsis coralli TaxID=2772213 RepID=A0ABR9P9Y5_9ACTN|nr:ROK family protein [Nocardiopsis coralli]MBE3000652.1 ROK family protein [Nocardiopsis coralli]